MQHTLFQQFSVAVGTLYFQLSCYHRLENRKFGTWNFVLNNPTAKQ